jgi:hypothetical protein
MDDESIVSIELQEGFEFAVDFGDQAQTTLTMDEPAPLGADHGPTLRASLRPLSATAYRRVP